jgi:RNA polymerase sigma factor (sigma-70 family)
MPEAPNTRASLLVRLRDPRDATAWSEFVGRYAPLVYGWARRKGLQDADAADVTQDVLRSFAGAAANLRYDPARGAFRGWLFTVTRNKLHNFRARRASEPPGAGDTATLRLLDEQPGPDEQERWEQEYRRRLFTLAAERARPQFEDKTWRAFWLTAVDGRTGEEAAQTLKMSVGAVYVAKNRVLAWLRREVRELEEE